MFPNVKVLDFPAMRIKVFLYFQLKNFLAGMPWEFLKSIEVPVVQVSFGNKYSKTNPIQKCKSTLYFKVHSQ